MKKLILALTVMLLAAPAQANDDWAKALGIIIGGAIVIETLRQPQVNNIIVMPQHPYPQVDPRQVCHVDRYHRGRWVEIVHRNCYGEVLSIQTEPRY